MVMNYGAFSSDRNCFPSCFFCPSIRSKCRRLRITRRITCSRSGCGRRSRIRSTGKSDTSNTRPGGLPRSSTRGSVGLKGGVSLEFGCHIGGTSIVLANLGGRVTGCDIDRNSLALASLNAIRYGQRAALSLVAVGAGGPLPFANGAFDLVICNSVLEYVAPDLLGRTLAEIDRVLKPSGELLIYGTSNRVWPRESHSGRWFINYVPQWLDSAHGRSANARRLALADPPRICKLRRRAWSRGSQHLYRGSRRGRVWVEQRGNVRGRPRLWLAELLAWPAHTLDLRRAPQAFIGLAA